MGNLCYIEGQFLPLEKAALPVSDLIIQRGVGVFEVIATCGGRPLMLSPHLERLTRSAASVRIRLTPPVEEMKRVIREGIARMGGEVRVKVYLTGGDVFDGEKGFIEPRFFVVFDRPDLPPKEAYEHGATLEPLPFGRDDPSVKSVDYRTSYALSQSGALEVLYCPDGEITETGHSSFFLVLNGTLVTAPLSRVLKGTTRQAILELARGEGIPVEERCPLWSELPQAREAFITGSSKRVVPVSRVGHIVIGDGRPGPMTARLSELYLRRIEQWLE